MKRLNRLKFIVFLCSTWALQGCLPDSLTKFSKEAAKKTSTGSTTVVDDSGNTISASTFTNPTYFKMRQNVTTLSTLTFEVGKAVTYSTFDWIADGEFAKGTSVISAIYLRCALDVDSTDGITKNDILPPGISLTSDCKFTGTPSTVYSNDTTGNEGKPIPYYIRLYFKNIKGQLGTSGAVTCPSSSECYIKSNVFNMATYVAPSNLKMSQSDKIALKLSSFSKSITSFQSEDVADSLNLATVTSESNAIGLTKIQQTEKNVILVLRAIPITVSDVSEFVIGEMAGKYDSITVSDASGINVDDTITSDTGGDYVGVVSSKSTNTLTVFRSSGSTLGTTINSSLTSVVASDLKTNPAYGTVVNIDTVNKVVYITQSPDFSGTFAATDSIIPYNGTTALTITSIDSTQGIHSTNKVDNDNQYYSQEAVVTNAYSFFPVGSAITPLYPIVSNNDTLATENGITYSISPALPSGLTFCSSASISGCPGVGYIVGTFASEFDPTDFTITAKNGIGTSTYLFGLAARNVPKDLSYTRQQVIRVKNTSSNPAAVFYEGENIYQPIVSPATESIVAKIKRKFTDVFTETSGKQTMLEITTKNGEFAPGASIDSGRKYVSEKAYISSTYQSYNYNLVLYLSSVANFDVGNYIKNSGNAKARIIYIDKNRKAVYAQFLTPDVSSSTTPSLFSETDTVTEYDYATNASTSTTATISRLESETYKLAISGSFTGFDTGYDVTANTGTSKVGGYIYNSEAGTTNYIYVNNVSRTPSTTVSNVVSNASQNIEFKTAQLIAANERYPGSAPTTSISSVSHENLFVIMRSESIYLSPNVSKGTNLYYTIDSDLPKGITLNSSTGIISGTPTILTPRKTYVITAKNIMGSTSYKLDLEVRDEFSIAETSDSTSYVLHKVGDTQNTRGCSINASDILNGTGNLDIRCFMDTSEQDLYKLGLKFKALVGSGVCEYIQYAPFSFQQYPANTFADSSSARSYNYISGCDKDNDGTVASFLGTCSDTTYKTKETCTAATETWTAWTSSNYTTSKPKNSITYCSANYSDSSSSYPNCDEDSFTVVTYSSSINGAGKCVSSLTSSEVVKCNGNVNSCISGPVKDVLDSRDILKGYRSMIYQVSDGARLNWTHASPYSKGYFGNMSLANGTQANTLTTTQSDLNTWTDFIASLTSTAKSKANTKAQRNTALRKIPFVNGVPVYTFNCLDAAQEVKAKINIVVRDWDKSFKVTDSLDSETPALMNGSASDNQYLDWDNDYFTNLNILYSSDLDKADYTGIAANCSDTSSATFIDCLTAGQTWTPTDEYAFPGDEL